MEVRTPIQKELPSADAPPTESSAAQRAGRAEIRFDIFLANAAGQRVFNYRQVYPDDYQGTRAEVSLEGVRVELLLNRKHHCVDINQAARDLADLSARDPSGFVTIAAVPEVPWKWVVVAIDACARARVRQVAIRSVTGWLFSLSTVLVHDPAWATKRPGEPATLPFVLVAAPQPSGSTRTIEIGVLLKEGVQPWEGPEELALDRRATDVAGIREALAAAAGAPQKPAIRIAADAEASFKPVLDILRICADSGLPDISFSVVKATPDLFR